MQGVGFEPTRTNTLELKTNPLDQLGQPCWVYLPRDHVFPFVKMSFHFVKCLSISQDY